MNSKKVRAGLLLLLSAGTAWGGALEELSGSASPSPSAIVPRADAIRSPAVAGNAEGIGLSHSGDPFDIPNFTIGDVARLLKQAGGTHYRPHVPLKEAHPELSPDDLRRLGAAAQDPAVLEAMVDDLSRNGRWERIDSLVSAFTGQGIRLILVVGAGYRKEAPVLVGADGSRTTVSPDGIGRERYVTMVRWLAGAAVRRYASRVGYWQAENEINVAGAAVANGWRVRDDAWLDSEFCKRLVAAIAETVHAEGKRRGLKLQTTHNFATDLPWQSYVRGGDLAGDIGAYSAVAGLDIVGVDLYANYFVGWPMLDRKEAAAVRTAVSAAGGRPVWVLETGFPNGPFERDFGDKRQGEYFRKIFDDCYGAGAKVVLAFGWFWNPQGWYKDDPKPLPWWNPEAQEQYWSPVHVTTGPGGAKTIRFGPAWGAFEDAARRWLGAGTP